LSESTYTNADDSLNKRYYRALEVLFHCSREIYLPWRIIVNSLFADPTRLNKGNNKRTMKEYLEQWQDAGMGRFSEDRKNFTVSEEGRKLLEKESKDIRKYLRPIENRYLTETAARRDA
jgi:predicted transcriptional regulator